MSNFRVSDATTLLDTTADFTIIDQVFAELTVLPTRDCYSKYISGWS